MSSDKDIIDFLNGIGPSEPAPEEKVIGNGDAFIDGQAGVPAMGPPLIAVTLPEEDGDTITHGRGKLVYYAAGGRKFFGYYSDMSVAKEGNTITFTGTLKEE